MKKYLIVLLIIILNLSSCNNKQTKQLVKKDTKEKSIEKTHIYSNKKIHNFGKIKEGEIIVCNFYIKNTGKNNLIIKQIETSCGCTIVKWDKKPIPSDETIKIEVEFNSSGRFGKQYKVITIFANIPQKIYELVITANVN